MILGILVTAVFAIWVTLTVLNQFDYIESIWRFDVFALIPRWTFFAPNPRTFEYRLYYSDRTNDGTIEPWIEVDLGERRHTTALVWNPDSRNRQALLMLVVNLLRSCRGQAGAPQQLMMSPAFSVMLRFLCALPAAAQAESRRFMLTRTPLGGAKPPNVLLVSHFFKLASNT